MDGTIRENISFGIDTGKYTFDEIDKKIREACAQASATFIDDKELMPDGLETMVGQRGIKLSGG